MKHYLALIELVTNLNHQDKKSGSTESRTLKYVSQNLNILSVLKLAKRKHFTRKFKTS